MNALFWITLWLSLGFNASIVWGWMIDRAKRQRRWSYEPSSRCERIGDWKVHTNPLTRRQAS